MLKVTCALPEVLQECYPSLLQSGVLGFVIFIQISIKFLDLKILKIKEWGIDKIQLTHFEPVFSSDTR